MIKTKEGYLGIFTKYDRIIKTVIEPYIRMLTSEEMNYDTELTSFNQTGFLTDRELGIDHIEDGLEGVKFVHYAA